METIEKQLQLIIERLDFLCSYIKDVSVDRDTQHVTMPEMGIPQSLELKDYFISCEERNATSSDVLIQRWQMFSATPAGKFFAATKGQNLPVHHFRQLYLFNKIDASLDDIRKVTDGEIILPGVGNKRKEQIRLALEAYKNGNR